MEIVTLINLSVVFPIANFDVSRAWILYGFAFILSTFLNVVSTMYRIRHKNEPFFEMTYDDWMLLYDEDDVLKFIRYIKITVGAVCFFGFTVLSLPPFAAISLPVYLAFPFHQRWVIGTFLGIIILLGSFMIHPLLMFLIILVCVSIMGRNAYHDWRGKRLMLKEQDRFWELVNTGDVTGVTDLIDSRKGLVDYNRYKKTALHLAVQNGHREMVELLLARGVKVDAHDSDGNMPIHVAVRQGQEDIVERLLIGGTNINVKHRNGDTPLHVATESGHKTMVRFLLNRGARIDAKDGDGDTPLHVAWQNEHRNIWELLLEKGANVNVHDSEGEAPLHLAVETRDKAGVKLLLANGANIDATDKDGNTALHLAVKKEDKAILKLLLAQDAKIDSMDSSGETPLHLAIQTEDDAMVKLLLSNGADPNAASESHTTPLHLAAETGCKGIVELLLAKGADVNAKDNSDFTPVVFASREGHIEVAELLLKNGANVKEILEAFRQYHQDTQRIERSQRTRTWERQFEPRAQTERSYDIEAKKRQIESLRDMGYM